MPIEYASLIFQERRHEYFVWAKKVVANLRGTNEQIENLLDEVFKRNLWISTYIS